MNNRFHLKIKAIARKKLKSNKTSRFNQNIDITMDNL